MRCVQLWYNIFVDEQVPNAIPVNHHSHALGDCRISVFVFVFFYDVR